MRQLPPCPCLIANQDCQSPCVLCFRLPVCGATEAPILAAWSWRLLRPGSPNPYQQVRAPTFCRYSTALRSITVYSPGYIVLAASELRRPDLLIPVFPGCQRQLPVPIQGDSEETHRCGTVAKGLPVTASGAASDVLAADCLRCLCV